MDNSKIMKSSADKTIIVKINGNKTQVTVDSNIFDDVFIEAVTRVVEENKTDMSFFHKIRIIAECYEKTDKKSITSYSQINMYHILINAGLYSVAELLREKTKNLHKVDLQLEPIHANVETH